MRAMAQQTRERIVSSSAELFRRQGFTGTGVKQIVAEASAPFGSLYHFFPGGKDELGAETIRWSGALYGELIGAFFVPGRDPVQATREFFAAAAQTLVDTDYADACPIATVALEIASTSEPMRVAAAEAFESWLAVLEASLARAGIAPARARELAVELFCAIEGAFLLSRVTRSTEAVEVAGRSAAAGVAAALELSPGAARPRGTPRRRRTPG
jgi:AcrR family transcriptional regulator